MRLIILFLLLSLGGQAQIIRAQPFYINNIQYLLDYYPGAGAAFSLRKLDKDYTGSAVKIRRSNDNATQDIGFTSNGDLDTSSMKTFIGSNSAFIDTWYDQSGNNRNAVQATTANQPRIINAGIIERNLNQVSVYFDGSNDRLNPTDFALPTSSIFSVAKTTGSNSSGLHTIYCRGTSANNSSRDALLYIWRTNNTLEFQRSDGTTFPTSTISINTNNTILATGIYTGSALNVYSNGTLGTSVNTTVSGAASPRVSAIGVTPEASTAIKYFFLGYLSEIIVYASNQSSNRTGIETNINNYYKIY